MKIPKRFKLHELGAPVVFTGDALCASDGVCAVRVPVGGSPEEARGLPMLQKGDQVPLVGALTWPAKALAESTQGTQGEGTLYVGERDIGARRSPAHPMVRWDVLPTADGFEDRLKDEITKVIPGYGADIDGRTVGMSLVLNLDPERLVAMARAMGAQDGLKLIVDFDIDGICRSQIVCVPVEVRGPVGVLMPIVKEGT